MLQGITPGSLYNAIPNFSNKLGALALATLIFERVFWSVKQDNPPGTKSFLIGLFKVDQIVNIPLAFPSLLNQNTSVFLALVTSLPVAYTHTVGANAQNARYHVVNYVLGQFFNIVAKTINSFVIGKMAHEAFCKGQKPGALMAATTVLALGLSASNLYSDWKDDAKLRRYSSKLF
ncbi:MAG: hypothetical protein KBA81_01980 [Rhabdochlamydiaceae bacterium]|nr:hypothetical protein [Rhabdochlamydiaceae bacterium]